MAAGPYLSTSRACSQSSCTIPVFRPNWGCDGQAARISPQGTGREDFNSWNRMLRGQKLCAGEGILVYGNHFKDYEKRRRRKGTVEAIVREVVTVGTAAASVTSTGTHHVVLRVALATVTQVAVTAAVCYGAYLSPYAEGLKSRRAKHEEENAVAVVEIDGVDVTGHKVFLQAEVQKAIEYAREAHAGQFRRTGEPYITHCIHTARILADLIPHQQGKRVIDTIIAGILHDVIDDTDRDHQSVRLHFGDDVSKLVAGVSKLSNINQLLRRQRRKAGEGKPVDEEGLSQAEVDDLRMMLLGMVNDPRVVLIKLADRLHNMRTIYALPEAKASAVAQETLAVWCSLASKLGEWAVKAELEDLCFAVLYPEAFRKLRAELAAIWSPRKDWRSLRRITKRAKRRALLYGELLEEELEPKHNPEDDEVLTMQELLQAVVPFEVLSDRKRRKWRIVTPGPGEKKLPKVIRDAKVALAALSACEEALERELLIATSYVPGMEVRLSGRLKSLYSTWCKMRRKGVGVDQIFDARALRVIVGDGDGKLHVAAVEGCYNLLSVVHSLWKPVGGEFDDYILNPKPSGYQSLHTAVQGPDGAPLEVQIRTRGMHDHAEYGHAAHWLYKEGDTVVKATTPMNPPVDSPLPDSDDASDDERESDTEEHRNQYGRPIREVFAKPSPRRPVYMGHPALRVEDGRLLAAVIVGVMDEGRELLVAASFALHAREAVAAGRFGNQRKRWLTYCRLYKKVADQWWFAPGHGDWSTCLEKYTLCRDGLYHKQDQFDRSLPTFIQLLDLNESEQDDYWKVMSMVEQGEEVDIFVDNAADQRNDLGSGTSTTTRLNNKVKLLRSMLQWEQELRHEVAPDGSVTILNPDHPETAALVEVLVISWPDGDIMRMPAGSTAADLARRMGMDGEIVFINHQAALPHTKLRDGDLVETRTQVPSF